MADVISGSLLLDLLPQDLRGEMCIADIALRDLGRSVTFRMDPGRAFEQRGTIADTGGGWYCVSIAERYRPGDPLTDVTGTYGMSDEEVPEELRGAACRAWTRGISRPRWRDALDATAPKVLDPWPFLSVTPEGAWSVHQGGDTYPVSGHPDPGTFAGIRPDAPMEPRRLQIVRGFSSQVRVANRDSFGIGPPTAAPVERGPTWTSDEAGRTRGSGRGR